MSVYHIASDIFSLLFPKRKRCCFSHHSLGPGNCINVSISNLGSDTPVTRQERGGGVVGLSEMYVLLKC